MDPRRLPVLAIAGPTASGKTAAALALARSWGAAGVPVEIVSVDSALVYRGMDIGTAKPSAAEQAVCPHHLIDVIEPTQAYSAAEFVADATRLVGAIRARGALPLLVGGTMLYFKALFGGMDALPAADAEVRAAIDARARELGWPALHAELAQVDPVTAARLAPRDAQRIQRALEVWQVSGQPLSSFHSGRFDREAAPEPLAIDGQPCRLIALEPTDRAWLHARIAQRFEQMLAEGLIDEVRRLRARRPAPGPALDALRRLPPGLGDARRHAACHDPGRARHRSHAPARQAPAHLAAQPAAARGAGLRRPAGAGYTAGALRTHRARRERRCDP
jgi:tRNA dimethylallyltransferase